MRLSFGYCGIYDDLYILVVCCIDIDLWNDLFRWSNE